MAVITTLAVNMVAKTSSFDKGMKRSQKNMRSFQSTAAKAGTALKGLFTGLLAYVGVRALTGFTSNTMAAIDATAKLSDRINIATEDIIGMRHAAQITGVSVEGMDKSLEMMVRRLGEVRQGTGEAKRALESLGLDVNKLVKLSPAMAFRQIADEINQMSNQSDKAAAAYQLFGRQGIKLLNTLKLGSRGLAEMQAEAEKLGLTFNRFDAAKIEAASDAITRLKSAFKGLGQEIVIVVSPALEKISDSITNTLTKYRQFRKGIKELLGGGFVGPPAPEGLSQQMANQAEAAAASAEAYVKATDKVIKFNEGLRDQIRLFGATANEKAIDRLNKVRDSLTGINRLNFDRFIGQSFRLADSLDKLGEKAFNIKKLADNFAKLKNLADSLIDSIKTNKQRFAEFGKEVDNLRKKGFLSAGQMIKILAKKREELFPVKELKAAALKVADKMAFTPRPGGQSQEIRTAFINVAALSALSQDSQVNEQKRTNQELMKQTQILRNMEANSIR